MDDFTLIHGDCLEVMKDIPAGCVDAVITDMPYGTTQCAWDEVIPFAPMWEQSKRINNGCFVMLANQPFTTDLIQSNRKWFRYLLVWDKVNRFTGYGNAKQRPLRAHEDIIIFANKSVIYNPQMGKGEPYHAKRSGKIPAVYIQDGLIPQDGINHGERYPTSIIKIKADIKATALHPTQKPVALMEYLILTYTNPGDTVLDFAMGSGTTGVACHLTNRRFIGIEIDKDYYDIATRRIAEARRQTVMPL